jgi:hypothetical protein
MAGRRPARPSVQPRESAMSLASFSDAELDQIMAAARPLPPARRPAFVNAVAAALEGSEVGEGAIHRVVIGLQRQFLNERQGDPYRRR